MIKVLYYYYYLFYTKIIRDDEPHATTIFTLSFSLSLIINGLLDILLACFFKYNLERWVMLSMFGGILLLMSFIFGKKRVGKKIVKEKPKLFNSEYTSIIFTSFIFLLGLFFLFLTPIITKKYCI